MAWQNKLKQSVSDYFSTVFVQKPDNDFWLYSYSYKSKQKTP